MLATMRQTAELVDFFQQKGKKTIYQKDDFIIAPGEAPSGVFYIVEGLVKAYDITRYGEENLLIVRKGHEIFPLIWALTGRERQVIYQALDKTTTFKVSRNEFVNALLRNPEILTPVMDMTVEMYRLHSERILNLEYRSVRERIVSFLLTMAQRFGTKTPEGLLIDVPLRHQDIASSINSSRETTSRELGSMEQKGIIGKGNGRILLKRPDVLQAYLSRKPATDKS